MAFILIQTGNPAHTREVFHYTWRAHQMSFLSISFSRIETAPWFNGILRIRNQMTAVHLLCGTVFYIFSTNYSTCRTLWIHHPRIYKLTKTHCITVTSWWKRYRLKSPALPMFTQPFIQADKKSNLRVTGLCVGIHRWPVISPHKWPVTGKMFPFDDVIMGRAPQI